MSKRFSKIYIEVTNYCNLNCSFCSNNVLPKKEMSIEEFKIAIEKVKNYTDSIYLHVKGEPLLHKKIDKILDICDDNNVKVNITTNGTLLKKQKNVILNHKIKQINVSLHCENNLSNYFEDVFTTCDELSNNTIIIYRIWTLSSLKLDPFSTNIVEKINMHYNLSKNIVNKIKNDKNIKIEDNIYIDKDFEFTWPQISDEKNEYGTCLGTRTHIAILSNGNIVPCCLDSNGVIILGNIFKDDLEKVLNNQEFIKINNGFKNNKIVNELCRSCTYRIRFNKKKDIY